MLGTLDSMKTVRQMTSLLLSSDQIVGNIFRDQSVQRNIEKLDKSKFLERVLRAVASFKLYKITA